MRAWSQSRLPSVSLAHFCMLRIHVNNTSLRVLFPQTWNLHAFQPAYNFSCFFFFCFLFFYYASLRGKNQRCTTKLTEQLSAWSAKHHKTARLPFPCCRFRWESLGSLRQHCHPSPSHSVPLSEGTDAKTSDTYTLKAHSKLIFHHRTLDLSPQEKQRASVLRSFVKY